MMKNKKSIEKCISNLELLIKYMPSHSMFGDPNHDNFRQQIFILKKVLTMDEYSVKAQLESEWDRFEDYEGTPPTVQALDWVLGNTDDNPGDDKEVSSWKKNWEKKQSNKPGKRI